jgi:peptide/nickel transport system substrate-binding protein
METLQAHPHVIPGVRRRHVLKAALAAGVTLSTWPLQTPSVLWGAEAGPPKRGGILRVRGYDPPHFDPLTLNFKAQTTLSFVYNRLVRHQVGAEVPPGTFIVEPDLAERWEAPDDTTYVFHLRHGVHWHNKPPVNGRELVAEDVQFTFYRFRTEQSNPLRFMLDPVDRVEVVDRYTVKFVLKEPFVWLVETLANPIGTWIVAPEVVQHFGDLKKPESAIGTGPFLLERYEPNVKTVFTRNPTYFRTPEPYVDGVEWLVLEDESTGLAMYRTGQLDAGPWHFWVVRQEDLDAMKKNHPSLRYQDFKSNVTAGIYMRTDQRPFTDVRVRRAISHAIDRQALIDAVFLKGEPTPAVARGVPEWSPRIDDLGAGAKYYQYNPPEAKRLLAEAGFPTGFTTHLWTTPGLGPALLDATQLVQRDLKEVGITATLKMQEFGAYIATTFAGNFEGLSLFPFSIAWEPHNTLYGMYMPDQPRNCGHVNDPTITAMLREEMRTQDLEARKKIIFDLQRYAAEQQYYVYLYCIGFTGSWQPYVKNYAPNPTFDYGGRAAALWLER